MKKLIFIIPALTFVFYMAIQAELQHELNVSLDIKSKSIEVIDSIYIPLEYQKATKNFGFKLNKDFELQSLEPKNFKLLHLIPDDVNTKYYAISLLSLDKPRTIFPVKYSGKIEGEIKSGAVEYARGFSETSGIISDDGVYLSGDTYWVPQFGEELFSFNLTVAIDTGWSVVSQGERTINEQKAKSEKMTARGNKSDIKSIIRYESPEPMDQVYLIAGKWTEYSRRINTSPMPQPKQGILVQTFLRKPDEELANRYLNVTGKFLEMYERLLGVYPYKKFAIVENFWETGYGMPSFTLLGEKVIRFPFILFSSYPHELLHNWWGNSVYVDYEKGNWCEGLTAYMADHLFKEQQGQGWEYRRTTLQKYTDYVNENNDFSVVDFKSRQNPAQEAIGYGKSLMFEHMLRLEVGDNNFIKAYRKFYNDYKFKIASFDYIRRCFEEVTGRNLKSFFDMWLVRSGAPKLELSNAAVKDEDNNHIISFKVSQTQKEDVFDLTIPIAVYLEGYDEAIIEKVHLAESQKEYKFQYEAMPLRIELDPLFDVFRKLDRLEVPNTISQVFGAKDAVIVLPSKSPYLKEYENMADMFRKSQEVQGNKLEVKYDKDIEIIPSDREVWLIGFENKFTGAKDSIFLKDGIFDYASGNIPDSTLKKLNQTASKGSLVFSIPNPINLEHTVCFVGSRIQSAIPALTSKLPHYGKYSFLGFDGESAVNTVKGEMPVMDTPMRYIFWCTGHLPKLAERKALIQ